MILYLFVQFIDYLWFIFHNFYHLNFERIDKREGIWFNTVMVANKSLRPVLIMSERVVFKYSIFLQHLLVGLADESISAILVCPPDCDVDSFITGGADIIKHPFIELPLLERLDRKWVVEQLQKFNPNILHCLCESRASLTRWLARQLNLPYVLMVDSLPRRWRRLSVSSRRCAKIIVPAFCIAESIKNAYPGLTERLEQINVGTFVEKEAVCFSKPSRLISIIMDYSLNEISDVEVFFEALKHLSVEGYEFVLAVMGQGAAERRLWKLLNALDLLEAVTIIPRLKPWRSVLAAGDIFIQPKPSYSFNPLLLEAMGLGIAVAACKGGVDDLIIQDKTAVVFDPEDVLSIRNALKRLFDRPEFARQLARDAQKYLRENHSVSNMIAATLQTYHEAVRWHQC